MSTRLFKNMFLNGGKKFHYTIPLTDENADNLGYRITNIYNYQMYLYIKSYGNSLLKKYITLIFQNVMLLNKKNSSFKFGENSTKF